MRTSSFCEELIAYTFFISENTSNELEIGRTYVQFCVGIWKTIIFFAYKNCLEGFLLNASQSVFIFN